MVSILAYSFEDEFPFTDKEIHFILNNTNTSNTYLALNSCKRIVSKCHNCGEFNPVIAEYLGDGDYSFISKYRCESCDNELKYFMKGISEKEKEIIYDILEKRYYDILIENKEYIKLINSYKFNIKKK